jgi:hypothetical protein
MVYFQTKIVNLGTFWEALEWKMLVYIMAICNTLQQLGKCYGPLVYFLVIWHISPFFGMLYLEKSGNPGPAGSRRTSRSNNIVFSPVEKACNGSSTNLNDLDKQISTKPKSAEEVKLSGERLLAPKNKMENFQEPILRPRVTTPEL